MSDLVVNREDRFSGDVAQLKLLPWKTETFVTVSELVLCLFFIISFCSSARHYDPPDVPGYFDAVVWPEHLKHLDAIQEQQDIGRFILVIDTDHTI